MARVFVAAWPPPRVRAALAALPRPSDASLRWVPTENLHVTLRFLGDVEVHPVVARLETAPLPRSLADLGPALAMFGSRVLMAPVAGLDALAAATVAATRDLGAPPPDRPFVGHVTVARCRDEAAGHRGSGTPVAARWSVTEVAVVTSETHPGGARYTRAATIPLTT